MFVNPILRWLSSRGEAPNHREENEGEKQVNDEDKRRAGEEIADVLQLTHPRLKSMGKDQHCGRDILVRDQSDSGTLPFEICC